MASTRRPSTKKRSASRRRASTKLRKTLALVAHDGKKAEMLAFALDHSKVLDRYDLVGTNTTSKLLESKGGLKIRAMLSGPLGGDAQIAAMVAQGEIEAVFFFIDPLGKHSHDPDIHTLMRICNVHEVPLATNPATASFVISEKTL